MLAGTDIGARRRDEREMEAALRHYEGLIFTTAQQLIRAGVEDPLEDIRQVLRVKAWKAIRAYDPTRTKMTRDRYVFMCIADQKKDIGKKKRRCELMIEDIATSERARDDGGPSPRDKFDARYLSVDHEQVFGDIEDDAPFLPNTLTDRERSVLALLYRNFRQTEIAEMLFISKRDVESAVRAIRSKLADWRPPREDARVPVAA